MVPQQQNKKSRVYLLILLSLLAIDLGGRMGPNTSLMSVDLAVVKATTPPINKNVTLPQNRTARPAPVLAAAKTTDEAAKPAEFTAPKDTPAAGDDTEAADIGARVRDSGDKGLEFTKHGIKFKATRVIKDEKVIDTSGKATDAPKGKIDVITKKVEITCDVCEAGMSVPLVDESLAKLGRRILDKTKEVATANRGTEDKPKIDNKKIQAELADCTRVEAEQRGKTVAKIPNNLERLECLNEKIGTADLDTRAGKALASRLAALTEKLIISGNEREREAALDIADEKSSDSDLPDAMQFKFRSAFRGGKLIPEILETGKQLSEVETQYNSLVCPAYSMHNASSASSCQMAKTQLQQQAMQLRNRLNQISTQVHQTVQDQSWKSRLQTSIALAGTNPQKLMDESGFYGREHLDMSLDIRNRILRGHNRADLITSQGGFNGVLGSQFDPHSSLSEEFRQALQRISNSATGFNPQTGQQTGQQTQGPARFPLAPPPNGQQPRASTQTTRGGMPTPGQRAPVQQGQNPQAGNQISW
jgi:hypothetical protein